jgi:hypothetical protein
LLEAAIKKITFMFSQHIMGKMQKKSPPKTPPSTGAKTRKSPRQQKATERKRGSGLVGRGGKIGKMGGRGRPFSSSSESESDEDDESNEEDERHHGHIGMKTSKTTTREELITMLREKERTIKKLQAEMDCMKNKSKPSKKTLRDMMKWSGEEINFSESVNTFVQVFLFPQYKFLKDGWQNYQPNKNDSLSLMCLCKLSLPEGSKADDIWERVIVPSIQMKYVNIKGNMNNDLKKTYLSMICFVKCDLKNVFY